MDPSISKLQSLLGAKSVPKPSIEEEGVWNLLVQILLPLVLVLTFVLLIVFSVLSLDIEKYKDTIHSIYQDEEILGEIAIAKIELQWLRLSKNANALDAEERARLRIARYGLDAPAAGLRWSTIQGTDDSVPVIDDGGFSEFCRETYAAFRSVRTVWQYKTTFYEAVIADTGLDSRISSPIDWDHYRNVESPDVEDDGGIPSDRITVEEQVDFEEGILAPVNADRLANLVNQIVSQMRDDVGKIQSGVVEALVDKEMVHKQITGAIGAGEVAYYKQVMDPETSREDRKEAINAWWRLIFTKLKRRYIAGKASEAEYPFLGVAFREI